MIDLEKRVDHEFPVHGEVPPFVPVHAGASHLECAEHVPHVPKERVDIGLGVGKRS